MHRDQMLCEHTVALHKCKVARLVWLSKTCMTMEMRPQEWSSLGTVSLTDHAECMQMST